MKKVIRIQIIINVIFLIITLMVILGSLVNVKYNYDDPVNGSIRNSQDLYDLIDKFGLMILIYLSVNIVYNIIALNKSDKEKNI